MWVVEHQDTPGHCPPAEVHLQAIGHHQQCDPREDNSPKVIKDHYLEARTKEEAKAYFRVLPGTLTEQKRK